MDPAQTLRHVSPSSKQHVDATPTINPLAIHATLARGYTSDEEPASPVDANDNDHLSLHSLSDTASDNSSFIEPSIQTAVRGVQLSNRAQLVTLVSVGKVKLVSMPSPQSPPHTTPTQHKRQWSNSSTRTVSPRDSTSTGPSRPFSFIGPSTQHLDPTDRRRRPSLPMIRTSPSSPSTSPHTPARTIHLPDYLRHDPFPSCTTPHSPPTKRSAFPTFNLTRMIIPRKRRDSVTQQSSSSSSDDETPARTRPRIISTDLSPLRSNKPKMIARGANEVEPTIRLPPCPDAYDAELLALPADPELVPRRRMSLAAAGMGVHRRVRSVMV